MDRAFSRLQWAVDEVNSSQIYGPVTVQENLAEVSHWDHLPAQGERLPDRILVAPAHGSLPGRDDHLARIVR